VFPAHAGMNRVTGKAQFWIESVPRTRGDEPKLARLVKRFGSCSPHTRG